MTVIECKRAGYEVQDVAFGKVYKWYPGNVVVECECGKRMTLANLKATCEWCGTEHAALVQEELENHQLEDEAIHPWRCADDRRIRPALLSGGTKPC